MRFKETTIHRVEFEGRLNETEERMTQYYRAGYRTIRSGPKIVEFKVQPGLYHTIMEREEDVCGE